MPRDHRLHRESGFDTSHWHHIPWGVDYALHAEAPGAAATGAVASRLPRHTARAQGRTGGRGRRSSRPELKVELRLYGGSFHEQDYEHELRRIASSDPRIIFMGTYEHSELHGILAELDAVVVPSIWHENLPTAGLNAIAAGVPLLVSDVGGLLELVDDYDCGLAFRRGDAEDLAAAARAPRPRS